MVDLDLVRKDSGEVVASLPMPEHVRALMVALGSYVLLYGVPLDADHLRFGP